MVLKFWGHNGHSKTNFIKFPQGHNKMYFSAWNETIYLKVNLFGIYLHKNDHNDSNPAHFMSTLNKLTKAIF